MHETDKSIVVAPVCHSTSLAPFPVERGMRLRNAISSRTSAVLVFAAGLCVLLLALGSNPAHAVPPTPVAELRLPDAESLSTLEPKNNAFSVPITVRAAQDVPALRVMVKSLAVGKATRKAAELRTYAVRSMSKGESERIPIEIEQQKASGVYRIEIALQGKIGDREGVLSKRVLYQVVDDGVPRLMRHRDLRRLQVQRRKKAFESTLEAAPESPDIRLLSENMVRVTPEQARNIKLYSGPQHRRVNGSAPPAALKSHIIDWTSKSERSNSPALLPLGSTAVAVIQAQGQIVFEDFYTNTPLDPYAPPVVTPLSNATVSLYQRAPGGIGPSYYLGETVTDANGHWSIDAPPAIVDYPVYYLVRLSNDAFDVRDDAGNDYTWVSDLTDGIIVNFGQQTFTTDAEAAQVFAVIDRGWNHIAAEGGQDPGHIAVQYPDICASTGTSCWDPADEVVRIESGKNNSPDVILHEYGHALLFYAFGGNSVAGGAHSFSDEVQDPGVAYGEGWATAFALSVCPDGYFTWQEAYYEDAAEWPVCNVDYDYAEWIEGYCYPACVHSNREGWLHEGRVAAAITDFLDVPNDDNDGLEDRGRTGYEDANDSDRISLAAIYRDNMWGYLHSTYPDFYTSLQGDLSGTTRSLASDINVYNYMAIPAPSVDWQCVASKVAMATSPDYTSVLDGLRSFRDKVLKTRKDGRRWIQSYYSHSPEMAMRLIASSEARRAAQTIVEHFSTLGRAFNHPDDLDRLARSADPALPPNVAKAIRTVLKEFESNGSSGLKEIVTDVRAFLRPYRTMTIRDAVRRVAAMEPVTERRGAPTVRPREYSPGSRNVDWPLIKRHLPPDEHTALARENR